MTQNYSDKEYNELSAILARLEEKYDLEFEKLAVDIHEYEILNITNMRLHLDRLLAARKITDPLRDLPLWAKVWPSALVLGRFLRKMDPSGKSLLELGSGMGICSIIASAYGFSRIVISDANPVALDFARANILKNRLSEKIRASLVEIGAQTGALAGETFDIIAASELLYLDRLHRPLLKFLQKHLAPSGRALFCTDTGRLKPGFKKLAERDFSVTEGHIGVKSDDEGKESRRIYNILVLERK